MLKRMRSQSGFTLVELLVVLAILAILLAVVSYNLTGFPGRSKQSSCIIDRVTIQAAVDAYYASGAATRNKWPTDGGLIGASPANYIDFSDLTTNRYLEAVPSSASSDYHSGGNAAGSYGWYIDAQGLVKAGNTDLGEGYNGNYP